MPRPRSAAAVRLDLGEQLGVGEGAALATLGERDQGRLLAATDRHLVVDGVERQVGQPALEPAEGRRFMDEDAVPPPEPREVAGGPCPEPLGVVVGLGDDVADRRGGVDLRGVHRPALLRAGSRHPRHDTPARFGIPTGVPAASAV